MPRDLTGDRRAPHVVIVGAGFAGLAAARALGRLARETPMRITLLDKQNYHTFQPLLYQAATAGLEPHSIGRNLRSTFRKLPVDVLLGEVVGVDREARRVDLRSGRSLEYDILILAVGTATADYGIDGVADHTFPLKWLPDATSLRDHLLTTFERLEAEPEPGPTGRSTFLVAGGGPTGVELAGAISELIDRVIRRDHRHVDPASTRVILVEMADAVLPPYSPRSQRYARKALEARGVEVRVGTAIASVSRDHVELETGERIDTETVIWTAGIKANPLAEALDAQIGPAGRVIVDADLRLPGDGGVFVIGDVSAADDQDGEILPQLAPVAMQQGQHVADQVIRLLRQQPTTEFRYRDKGKMATIGRRSAVAEIPPRIRLHGTVGWAAWLGLHLLYLVGFRNRLSVLLSWGYSYFTYDRAARLIVNPAIAEPGVEEPTADLGAATDPPASDTSRPAGAAAPEEQHVTRSPAVGREGRNRP